MMTEVESVVMLAQVKELQGFWQPQEARGEAFAS